MKQLKCLAVLLVVIVAAGCQEEQGDKDATIDERLTDCGGFKPSADSPVPEKQVSKNGNENVEKDGLKGGGGRGGGGRGGGGRGGGRGGRGGRGGGGRGGGGWSGGGNSGHRQSVSLQGILTIVTGALILVYFKF